MLLLLQLLKALQKIGLHYFLNQQAPDAPSSLFIPSLLLLSLSLSSRAPTSIPGKSAEILWYFSALKNINFSTRASLYSYPLAGYIHIFSTKGPPRNSSSSGLSLKNVARSRISTTGVRERERGGEWGGKRERERERAYLVGGRCGGYERERGSNSLIFCFHIQYDLLLFVALYSLKTSQPHARWERKRERERERGREREKAGGTRVDRG